MSGQRSACVPFHRRRKGGGGERERERERERWKGEVKQGTPRVLAKTKHSQEVDKNTQLHTARSRKHAQNGFACVPVSNHGVFHGVHAAMGTAHCVTDSLQQSHDRAPPRPPPRLRNGKEKHTPCGSIAPRLPTIGHTWWLPPHPPPCAISTPRFGHSSAASTNECAGHERPPCAAAAPSSHDAAAVRPTRPQTTTPEDHVTVCHHSHPHPHQYPHPCRLLLMHH